MVLHTFVHPFARISQTEPTPYMLLHIMKEPAAMLALFGSPLWLLTNRARGYAR